MSPPANAAPPPAARPGGEQGSEKKKEPADRGKTRGGNRGKNRNWFQTDAVEDIVDPVLLPLDQPKRSPFSCVEGERRVIRQQLDEVLGRYDTSDQIPRPEDEHFGSRSGYDIYLRIEGLKVLRQAMEKDYCPEGEVSGSATLWGANTAEKKKKVVLIGMIAVHMATEERLQRLRHVLKSVARQKGLPPNCELVIAISWFSPTPDMAERTEEVLRELVLARAGVSGAARPQEGYPEVKIHSHAVDSPGGIGGSRGDWPFSRPRKGRPARPVPAPQPKDTPFVDERDRPLYETEEEPAQDAPSGLQYSVCAAPLGLEPSLEARPHGQEPLTVIVRQRQRHTQFQHIRAALSAAEAVIHKKWNIGPGDESNYSFWCMFGDDDDLWHPLRAAAWARAITEHRMIDGVGSFATLSRANVESEEITPQDTMPITVEEVDAFLKDGRGTLNLGEEISQAYMRHLENAEDSASIPVPGNLDLEYFDFCPRLRLLHEFFESTSKFIVRHRLCDLRLCEFLTSYPIRGKEMGLEMSFFNPDHWTYFYANAFPTDEEWVSAIEDEKLDDEKLQPGKLGVKGGHVSAEVPIQEADIKLAKKEHREFKFWDEPMTEAKLARYLAYFRYYIEVGLVRSHTMSIDQRDFDAMVFEAAYTSFLGFTEKMANSSVEVAQAAGQLMLSVCQGHAKALLNDFGVSVLWYFPGEFIYPPGGRSLGGVEVGEDHDAQVLIEEQVLELFALPDMTPIEVALVKRNLERGDVSEASLLQVADVQDMDRDMVRRRCQDIAKGLEVTGGDQGNMDVAPHMAQVPEWLLDTWAQHEAANEILQHYTLQGSVGEVHAMSFKDILMLFKDFGVGLEELVTIFDDRVKEEDFESAAVNILRLYRRDDTGADESLRLREVYRFFCSVGIEPDEVVRKFAAAGFMPSSTASQEDAIVVDCFRVLRALGQGMTGSMVYLAEDLAMGVLPGEAAHQQVALKWPVSDVEVRALMAVQKWTEQHSGIPLMQGHGQHEDNLYLVTELLGSDLEKVFQRIEDQPLDKRWKAMRAIGRMLLRILEAVHNSGWVHCDFGSHNVLMGRPRDPKVTDAGLVVPYLIDFGCAQPHPGGGPLLGDVGSMEFSSARSADGGPRTPSDDLEALGWLMVHGLFGDLPWFVWLTKHYDLKPSLKAVKRDKLLEQVKHAKCKLLNEGWGSFGGEWSKLEEMPEDLDKFMRLCQVLPEATELPDYELLAAVLGASYGLEPDEAEEEDLRQYKADAMPLLS